MVAAALSPSGAVQHFASAVKEALPGRRVWYESRPWNGNGHCAGYPGCRQRHESVANDAVGDIDRNIFKAPEFFASVIDDAAAKKRVTRSVTGIGPIPCDG